MYDSIHTNLGTVLFILCKNTFSVMIGMELSDAMQCSVMLRNLMTFSVM